jgi:hypothetical protein
MDWENQTPFPALLLTSVLDEERMVGAVVVRRTYRLEGGELLPSPEQPWLVAVEPWDSPLGPFEADQPFRKGGVDLFVAGSACTPGRRPQAQVRVSVAVGAFSFAAIVFGERVWKKPRRGALVAGDPEPFVSLPLAAEHAFGGKIVIDGLELSHPDNPGGKGLYAEEKDAIGQPLPRIEDERFPIQHWDDRPDTVGFGLCPLQNGHRLRTALEIADGRITRVDSRLFNTAYPQMVAPKVEPGDRMTLAGLSSDGPIEFVLPPTGLSVHLVLGDAVYDRAPTIEEVGVDLPHGQVFVGYRYPFRYRVVPQQLRSCTLALREG